MTVGMTKRVAFYYAPEADDPLTGAAASWLGRDAGSEVRLRQPELPDIGTITDDPRLYSFHATLKPPMHLRDGVRWDDVVQAATAIAASVPAFELPRLHVADLFGFLALRESTLSPDLQAFADACVAGADHLRASPPEAELAKRRRNGALPPAEEANLVRWGYPYVFATWFFHMTLTRRLTGDERAIYFPAAEAHFAAAIAAPRRVVSLGLFTQAAPGAAFILAKRIPLAG